MDLPPQSTAPEYHFDDVRVDTRAHRVFKAGKELVLEPKAYGVLLVLLATPNLAIGRDRLLDAVWGHRHVTPAVLNRVIALLRRALGDDAEHPRLIRTVHGIGYSFIGTLVERANLPLSMETPRAKSLDASASPLPDPGPVRPALAARAQLAWRMLLRAAPERRRAVNRRRPRFPTGRTLWVFASSVLIVVLAATVWLTRPATRLSSSSPPVVAASGNSGAGAKPAEVVSVRIALLPIDTDNANDATRARAFTETLAEALARVPEFEVTGLDSARIAAASSDDPAALGKMLGTDHLLRGRLASQVDAITISLGLIDARNEQALWSQTFTRPHARLHEAIESTLDGLRGTLLPRPDNVAPDSGLRASAVAMALFAEAKKVTATTAQQRAERLGLLKHAVAADPRFALGWAALAGAERDRYQYGDGSLTDALTAAQTAVDRALALDPDLIEALTTQAYILTAQWRSAEALGVSRRALELAPNNAQTIATRANVLGYLGRPRESLLLRQRAVALDPLSPFPVLQMSTDYLTLGQREEALRTIASAQELAIGRSANPVNLIARIEIAFGNIAISIAEATRSLHANLGQPFVKYEQLNLARAWSLLGEHAEADHALSRVKAQLPEAPIYLDTWLTLRWARGDYAGAVRWIDNQGRHAAQEPWQHAASAQARALAGDPAGALADYALALDARADRDLIASSWFPGRFGMAPLANWIALRKTLGLPHAAELDDYARRLDEAIVGGTALPLIDYHRAALAALRDDTAEADRLLTAALARGWVDPLAFDVDLTWRPYAHTDWLARQRAAQAARIRQEQQRLRQLLPAAQRH